MVDFLRAKISIKSGAKLDGRWPLEFRSMEAPDYIYNMYRICKQCSCNIYHIEKNCLIMCAKS